MATTYWSVEYLTPKGEPARAQLFVRDIVEVRDEIRRRGGVLQRAKQKKHGIFDKDYFSSKSQHLLLQALAFHVKASGSPGQALAHSVLTLDDPKMKVELKGALDVLERGGSFTEGLKALNIFDDAIIGMLSAGELSGDLPTSIEAAQEYSREKAKAALAWKPFLFWVGTEISTAISALWWMFTSFIPKDLRANPPRNPDPAVVEGYLRAINLADFLVQAAFWLSILAMVGFSAVWLIYTRGRASSRQWAESLLLKFPGSKAYLLDESLAYTFGIAAHLVKARVRLSEVVPLLVKHSRVASVKEFWQQVGYRISVGSSLTKAVDHRFVDSGERVVISAHGDEEQLSQALALIAERRKGQAAYGRDLAFRFYTVATVAFLVAIGVLAIWLVSLQGKSFSLSTLQGLTGGF